jgi:type II secretory pathway component PulF
MKTAAIKSTRHKPMANANTWQTLLTNRREWSPANCRASKRNVMELLTMLTMLLENGLSLQKSLETLVQDRACRKQRRMLSILFARVSAGEAFSRAISAFPLVFSPTMSHHIAIAEASGTLIDSLHRITKDLEETLELRRKLVQKLSYPALVVTAGSGLVAFMLTSVVPQFEKIYSESNVSLPWVTSFITGLSRSATRYLWILPIAIFGFIAIWRGIRKNAKTSIQLDYLLMRLPLVGNFLMDLSALEYLRSALVLTEAGFVPLDALTQAAKSVPNRYARQLLTKVAIDVQRGQKISKALRPCEFLFPSAVLQLIAIGEQTGGLTQACQGSCQLVKARFETRMNAALGVIEPVMTISLAACIGWIVLAIYMPMFHMFDVLDF